MNYNKVYNPENLVSDHARPVDYELPLPVKADTATPVRSKSLYVHTPQTRASRNADDLVASVPSG